MAQYIDKSALVAEIEKLKDEAKIYPSDFSCGRLSICKELMNFLDTLEVKEVYFEKLGEIARHLIAVKEHIEDMRLDKEEWFLLEKIGYPERFKAQKGE